MTRNLFIGLGGTGGEVLKRLRHAMTEKQREEARYLYMDTSKTAEMVLVGDGIEAVRISSADMVEEVAEELGRDDGVYDWLPGFPAPGIGDPEDAEGPFRTSELDNGASQNRYKSRLCLARFLSNPNNALTTALSSHNIASAGASNETLRIMIVSSLAGGTGSGTFLQTALYIRKFFRERGQTVIITGLFSCPDIYSKVNSNDEEKVRDMFANAYAAMRELNAMNMAVGGARAKSVDYGNSINMKIDTVSEGKLFDSKDPRFTGKFTAKPYDLLYFIDQENAGGFELGSLEDYYQLMSDVAYTRLYSPLKGKIDDDISNELSKRSAVPTAIYGSAGYAKIVYPYEDIIRYLALRKVSEDLGDKWTTFDNAWESYRQKQITNARVSGSVWKERPEEREEHYTQTVDKAIGKPNSTLSFLTGQIQVNGKDRVNLYIRTVENACDFSVGPISGSDGAYGLLSRPEVKKARDAFDDAYNGAKDRSSKNALQTLTEITSITSQLETFKNSLKRGIPKQGPVLATAIFPLDAEGREQQELTTPELNIHTGLLQVDGADVHPLAARYLLYKLRNHIRKEIKDFNRDYVDNNALIGSLDQSYNSVVYAFDDDPNDNEDYLAQNLIQDIQGQKLFKERDSREALGEYFTKVDKALESLRTEAVRAVRVGAWKAIMEQLDTLITQYENFFANLDQFASSMEHKYRVAEAAHDYDFGSYVYVGASAESKRFYYLAEPSVAGAIEAGNDEVYAAEGSAIYNALIRRAARWLVIKQQSERMGYSVADPSDDKYEDLGGVFDIVVKKYMTSLREHASYLDMDVCTALVRECASGRGIDPRDILNSEANRTAFYTEFKNRLDDVRAKSRPMASYRKNNTEFYYSNEPNVSIPYLHMGISAKTAQALQEYFSSGAKPTSGFDLSGFKNRYELTNDPIIDDAFGSYEMVVYQAVHCLQPTQLTKFHEASENGYYKEYRKKVEFAIRSGILSQTPHLDKRWYRRGVMPYISRDLERSWREKLMKALTYAVLSKKIGFTVDGSNTRCYNIKRDGRTEFIHWPGNELVLRSNISRVVEYLSEDETLVDNLASEMDNVIREHKRDLANYSSSVAVYKGGMTRNGLLFLMRSRFVTALNASKKTGASGAILSSGKGAASKADEERQKQYEAKIRRLQKELSGETDETGLHLPDPSTTMGGVLEVAWQLHLSEEKLGEDRDYGEELLKYAMHVIEELATGMFGGSVANNVNDSRYQQFADIYNTMIQKFVRDYIIDRLRKGQNLDRLTEDEIAAALKAAAQAGSDWEEEDEPLLSVGSGLSLGIGDSAYPDLQNIPQAILESDAYIWFSEHWKLMPLHK